jgi:hypothetical protein
LELLGIFIPPLFLKRHRTKNIWQFCTSSACIFSVISHKNPLTGDSSKPKGNGFGTTAVNIAAEPACMIFAQADKKSDGASDAGSCAVLP